MNTFGIKAICIHGVLLAITAAAHGQGFEQEPIQYSKSSPTDRVSKLIAAIEAGKQSLKYDDEKGYLPAMLAALDVPQSSQTLVFSKTSLQRQRISPATPRALYFNDDTFVGYCRNGEALEISTIDNQLGSVFYTLDQEGKTAPRIVRQTDNCLICHGSSSTKGVPGLIIRSVYCNETGLPELSAGTFRTNHQSPLSQRWGGWYVTGTHGEQKHLGNLIVSGKLSRPDEIDNSSGQNVTNLSSRFDTKAYLTPQSDIVALMVLEHQVDMHNCITQANFGTRQAMFYQQALNRELGKPAEQQWDSTKSRIKSSCEPLVEYLFFCEEARLTAKVVGSGKFADEFAACGPRDKQGRSLREFDLKTRMFKYPCSYLVYSESFSSLPTEAKLYVQRRMHEILFDKDPGPKFRYLSDKDRAAIREILTDTLAGFAG